MLESHKHKHAVHEFDGIIENRVSSPPLYFTLLFYGLIAWGVIFIGYFLFSGWSSQGEFEEKMAEHNSAYEQSAPPAAKATPAAATAADDSIDAAALFAANCAGCHGADGTGGFGSDLTSSSYKFGKDQDAVKTSIAEGRGGKMPAFGDRLSDAEIAALADFTLNL